MADARVIQQAMERAFAPPRQPWPQVLEMGSASSREKQPDHASVLMGLSEPG